MDSNLFYIDWTCLCEVLVAIVVFSFFVERALVPLFEFNFYINKFQGKSLKDIMAFVVSALVCRFWDFNAFSSSVQSSRNMLKSLVVIKPEQNLFNQ